MIAGGRFEVRNKLYMCAMVAAHHNPVFKQFYERLVARGDAKSLLGSDGRVVYECSQ